MRPDKRKVLEKGMPPGAIPDQLEQIKACIRAKVGHPFRVIKRQFGYVTVRYRGLAKNTAQLHSVCTLQHLDGAAHVAAGDAGRLCLLHAESREQGRNQPSIGPGES